jgi:hypothetical protein
MDEFEYFMNGLYAVQYLVCPGCGWLNKGDFAVHTAIVHRHGDQAVDLMTVLQSRGFFDLAFDHEVIHFTL